MFRNDYSDICAPEVLASLSAKVNEQNTGYGLDGHSERAAEKILQAFGLSGTGASVHFLAGGTQTNMTVISYFLRPYEAVIACKTGHINVHETGAVEASGHKVIVCESDDGKMNAQAVEKAFLLHTDEHMVKPRMVYLSDSTETGTVYTKKELSDIRKVCDKYGLLLFLDGARLGVALTSEDNDMTPADLASFPDVFYVGGTKNGAPFGEAVVIKDKAAGEEFRYHVKNRGAMLAKGFVCGLTFDALFTDDLYFRLAKNSNRTAKTLREGLLRAGIPLVGDARTNQIFLRLPKEKAERVMDRFGCELWTDLGDEYVIRAVTSFSTKDAEVEDFLCFIGTL